MTAKTAYYAALAEEAAKQVTGSREQCVFVPVAARTFWRHICTPCGASSSRRKRKIPVPTARPGMATIIMLSLCHGRRLYDGRDFNGYCF